MTIAEEDRTLIDAAKSLFEPRHGTGPHAVWDLWISEIATSGKDRAVLRIRRVFALVAEGYSAERAILKAVFDK